MSSKHVAIIITIVVVDDGVDDVDVRVNVKLLLAGMLFVILFAVDVRIVNNTSATSISTVIVIIMHMLMIIIIIIVIIIPGSTMRMLIPIPCHIALSHRI